MAQFDEKYLVQDESEVVIQVNGKLRYKLSLPVGLDKAATEKMAMETDRVQELIVGKTVVKIIVIPDRLVNIVVR
ncbi:MAG: hypothetical protein R3C26_25320 [Calditrichia bacterium]